MIKDSYKSVFDTVIVWKLDRFARNRYDSARYKALLKKNGVRVISATEKISEDASGILLESLLEGYAEYYSAELAEKVKRGIPALIDKETFEMAQSRMARNKKAPAMHRAEDDYLLTTKLFCGHCGAFMVGEIGTSHTSKQYRYYKCTRAKKGNCKKKAVGKDYIENLVIDDIMELLSDNNVLEELAKRIYEMQSEQSFAVATLKSQLEEVEKKLDNLVEAITNGIYSSKTKQVLDELEERKKNLQEELYQEELDHPIVSEEQILHALYHYKSLDISTKEGKQRLIDGFVNSIYLYDDRYVITFNYKNKSKTVTFEEIESSSLTSKASPNKTF